MCTDEVDYKLDAAVQFLFDELLLVERPTA